MIVTLKGPTDIKGFIDVGKITAEVMSELIEKTQPGISTNDLNKITIEKCNKMGVRPAFLGYRNFPSAICVSFGNELVHGMASGRVFDGNTNLSIDLGVEKNGYIGDTAVTIGKEELIYDCKNALFEGIKKAVSGNKLSDISKEVFKYNRRWKIAAGYGGHGIDRWQLHAHPFVPNHSNFPFEDDITLRPGMILAIEPMMIDGSAETKISEDGWTVIADGNSAHFEHTILVTEGEPIILTLRDEEIE